MGDLEQSQRIGEVRHNKAFFQNSARASWLFAWFGLAILGKKTISFPRRQNKRNAGAGKTGSQDQIGSDADLYIFCAQTAFGRGKTDFHSALDLSQLSGSCWNNAIVAVIMSQHDAAYISPTRRNSNSIDGINDDPALSAGVNEPGG